MGLFGRRQRGRHASDDVADEAGYRGEIYDDGADDADEYGEDSDDGEFGGPYDEDERPDDELVRLDLGSVQVPLPPNAQIQVEMDPSGPLRAVHIISANARYTISAYASPRSMLLWPEISAELAEQLGGDGARVRKETGEWGTELVALVNNVLLRFVGVDGPRWMLRAVAQGPREQSAQAADELRDIVRETIVVRGVQPMPVRTPLPLKLPDEIAAHIEQAQGGAQG
ncbi:MAG TPA: DUF3710 domain-containing protein [Pseudonocardiaceae bacterium]|nr:DUF3710 domain-containing protein [Pseudonocardiaceae bacterium]